MGLIDRRSAAYEGKLPWEKWGRVKAIHDEDQNASANALRKSKLLIQYRNLLLTSIIIFTLFFLLAGRSILGFRAWCNATQVANLEVSCWPGSWSPEHSAPTFSSLCQIVFSLKYAHLGFSPGLCPETILSLGNSQKRKSLLSICTSKRLIRDRSWLCFLKFWEGVIEDPLLRGSSLLLLVYAWNVFSLRSLPMYSAIVRRCFRILLEMLCQADFNERKLTFGRYLISCPEIINI